MPELARIGIDVGEKLPLEEAVAWAARNGVTVGQGHRAGAENVRARLRDAVELGIEELTVYAFSTENWSRSPAEVAGLGGRRSGISGS